MRINCLRFLILLGVFFTSHFALAEVSNVQAWLNASPIGWGQAESGRDQLTQSWSLNLGYKRSQFQLRAFAYSYDRTSFGSGDLESCLGSAFTGCSGEDENTFTLSQWALLYGYRFFDGDLAISAGIGKDRAENTAYTFNDYKERSYPVEIAYTPRRHAVFGITVKGIASYSEARNFFAVVFGMNFGYLRGW